MRDFILRRKGTKFAEILLFIKSMIIGIPRKVGNSFKDGVRNLIEFKGFINRGMGVELTVLLMVVTALIIATPKEIVEGLYKIITHPSLLLVDYPTLAGLGATLINASLLILINLIILKVSKAKISGPVYAAIMITAGFAFFGKNIMNVWPIYLGAYIYAKMNRLHYRQVAIIAMFGTGIAPIVSLLMFGIDLPMYSAIPVGLIVGTIVGYCLVPISSSVIKYHNGYGLYNVGFAIGLIGILTLPVLNVLGFEIKSERVLETNYHTEFLILLILQTVIIFGLGLYVNKFSFKDYRKLLKKTGRAVTNFKSQFGAGLTLINIGLLGVFMIGYLLALQIQITGPIFGACLTVLGFGAFGKHPRNVIPIVAGATICIFVLLGGEVNDTVLIINVLFATALAPIAGEYGIILGVITGFIHMIFVRVTGTWHGGMVLYNNGFATGVLAGLIVPVIESFVNREEQF